MKKSRYKLLRGFTVIAAFICALFIGLETIASVSDYKVLINDILGVKTSVSGNADAYAFTSEFDNTVDMLTRRKDIAEQISAEGSVLLKNNGALPLVKPENGKIKATMLGSRAYTYGANGELRDSSLAFYGGIVGSPVSRQEVTVKDGTISLPITPEVAFADRGIELNPALKSFYTGKSFPNLVSGSEANGSSGGPFAINETNVSVADCGSYADYSDVCFVVVGRSSGEGREYLPGELGRADKSDGSKSAIGLSDAERNLITVAAAISDNVVVLVNSAIAMEIPDLKSDERVDAILWIGLPGAYGMNGVADILVGNVSPSGHLPDVYAADASASPAAQNFGVNAMSGGSFVWSNGGSQYNNADNSHYVVLAEDMYTGYYYYETRYADCVEDKGNASAAVGIGYGEAGSTSWNYEHEVVYPFGYGMSYSSFTQSITGITADNDAKTVTVGVKVKNTGGVKAKHVIQLYVSSPYTAYDEKNGVEKPAIQLVEFKKVELEKDEEQEYTLTADMKYFASYDKTAEHDGRVGGYILENADYYFAIGNGAHEAINNVLLKNGVERSALYFEDEKALSADCAIAWRPELDFDANGVNAALLSTSENGTAIENRLSDADYNYFKKDTVTYLSRSDWKETFPKAYTGLEVTSDMYDYLDSKVYKFSVGTVDTQFGVDHSEEEDDDGNPMENISVAEMKLASYDDERWEYLVEQITFDEAWALSPYGGTSCNAFLSVNSPELWQIDGPNGNVTRPIGTKAAAAGPMAVSKDDPNANYKANDMCCEPITAGTFNKELLKEQGKAYGEEMMWSGNTIIWAPGMNLHRTPFNSRNHEYYSEDPMLTNILGVAFVEGGLEKGAILAAKHFAFNTQESFREGLTQFMEEQSAREMELRAFQGLSEDALYVNTLGNGIQALGLMTSFSRIGVCGVNAHTGLMKEILRGEWGFKGMSSTDMVVGGRFFNPQDSVINNVTFMATSNAENLLNKFWSDYNNKNKVKNDPKLMAALHENMHYYMYAAANSNLLNGYDANTVITDATYGWQYAIKAVYWIMFVAVLALAATAVVFKIHDEKNNKEVDA